MYMTNAVYLYMYCTYLKWSMFFCQFRQKVLVRSIKAIEQCIKKGGEINRDIPVEILEYKC